MRSFLYGLQGRRTGSRECTAITGGILPLRKDYAPNLYLRERKISALHCPSHRRSERWSWSWCPLLPEVMRTPGKPQRAGQPDRARQTRKRAGFSKDERGHKLRRPKRGRAAESQRRGGWGRVKEKWVFLRTAGSGTPWSGVSLCGVGTWGDHHALSTGLLTSHRNAGGN